MTQRRIYQDEYPYFVTFRTKESQPIFEDTEYAKAFSEIMFNAGQLKGWHILAYQIMPEHVHVLCSNSARRIHGDRTLERVRSEDGKNGIPPERTFSNVRIYKSNTISDLLKSMKGNFSRGLHEGNIWQPRFHTRIVNTREYLATITEYIQNNPVKDNLPKKYRKVPYQYVDWERIRDLF